MKILKWFLAGLVTSSVLMPHYLRGQDVTKPLAAVIEPYRQAQFPVLTQGGFKLWDKGYLITHAWDMTLDVSPTKPGVVLYDREGDVAREPIVWIEGASRVSVADAAVNNSGRAVVAGGATDQHGAIANFIAEVGANDRVKTVVRTTPFMPVYVCALEDGTVWSYGVERDEHLVAIQNSLRLRQYSFEKGQLRAMLKLDWPLERGRYPGDITLRCNSNTVMLYNAGTGDLIEVNLQTNALTTTKVPPLVAGPNGTLVAGLALTRSGEVFASLNDRSQKPPLSGLFKLSRDDTAGAKWTPVNGTVGTYLQSSPVERLMGADGDDLVYTAGKDGRMFWSTPGTR